MVFGEEGKLMLAVGSPGGSRIINYVAKSLIGVLDWNLDIQQAINLPNITNRNDYTALEKGTSAEQLQPELEKMGHKVQIRDLNSGLHGFQIKNGMIIGGADPRREGVAVGQ
jgi:gamma-glutamyltranspeptidase/glutathione hydrolase